ncbi:MAG: YbfB/YjiJ family MFS transporter, partial [Rhodospirillales bacterium]|nr:YbfB/YjiJ family MFS transporter [Rhodospirillales bacterium]
PSSPLYLAAAGGGRGGGAPAAPAALLVSIIVVGALSPGIASLVSARLAEMVAPGEHAARWGRATLIFSIAQAGGAAVMSAAFAMLGSYLPLYAAGALLLACGAILAMAAALSHRPAAAGCSLPAR